ncbi:hypothetical protein MTR_5g024895 [Medicago truncatula]|uniref:Uncharacterized protein n=1 Tax=Medicago truncatula TaxID=3880 RepID=A0A072UDV4_MEDTR|nr:hypothetical protein MTR_5g024895 [Medicago truncatula]
MFPNLIRYLPCQAKPVKHLSDHGVVARAIDRLTQMHLKLKEYTMLSKSWVSIGALSVHSLNWKELIHSRKPLTASWIHSGEGKIS